MGGRGGRKGEGEGGREGWEGEGVDFFFHYALAFVEEDEMEYGSVLGKHLNFHSEKKKGQVWKLYCILSISILITRVMIINIIDNKNKEIYNHLKENKSIMIIKILQKQSL